ncbi:hypothetical protein RF55_10704 [Lasius niger]|uniref:Uncharacterized protein n=1 Tax=Lasius niger TaxID=67767 RepID=A0A0J7KHA0_LASNI|nr:hypothetical protein RF55_10704 [Lasius niger]
MAGRGKGKIGEIKARERSSSCGQIEEWVKGGKRKLEEDTGEGRGEEMEKEERKVFQPLKRLNRSPREWEKGIKDDVESAAEEKKGSREDIYCMQMEERGKERGEDRDLWKEIKILEGRIERQDREVEVMKRELERMKSREKDWKKERREWKEKIEELEGRMKVNKEEGGNDK